MTSTGHVRFGPAARFELHPRERRLLVEGRPASLGSRAFDLLLALVKQPDRLMSKSELLGTVWPGLVVEESNLHVQMSTLRKLLGGDIIATVPGRGYRFAADVQRDERSEAPVAAAAPTATVATPAANTLPPLRLVGRSGDLAAVEADLLRVRCLSLVGPGGVGKTSLARLAAARFAGRCVWADLASLGNGAQVVVAVARACGLALADGPPLPQLITALGTEPVLLVLDNTEHLVDGVAALVGDLLAALPQLRLLITSQVVLHGVWETVHRLEPLPLATQDGAQALLAERITAADPRIRLDDSTRPLLDAICRQLDGLPLALEMAAARVPTLGLKRVHDELAHRFMLLTTGRRHAAARYRTLHGALDWSCGLLDAEAQRLFRALGVWAGGFTLELAVAQMTDDAQARWDVVENLATLVDHSLVTVSAEDPPRYGLLETMRAYALEQLVAQGEEDAVRRRQAHVLLALLRYDNDAAVISTPERRAELENMNVVLPWLLQHDFAAAAELCIYGASHDTFTRWIHQSSRWMETMESRLRGAEGQALPARLRLEWWTAFARTMVMRRNVRDREVARHACSLARAADDDVQLHMALIAQVRAIRPPGDAAGLAACAEMVALDEAHPEWPIRRRLASAGAQAHCASVHSDHDRVLSSRRKELALALENGSTELVDHVRSNLLAALSQLGRYAELVAMADELLPRLEQKNSTSLPWAYDHYLTALALLDRWPEFDRVLPRTMALAWQSNNFSVLEALMKALSRQSRLRDNARVWGLVRRLESGGDLIVSHLPEPTGALLADLRAAFDEATLQALWAEGATLDQAGLLALMRGPGVVSGPLASTA